MEEQTIHERIQTVLPLLNENQRRLYLFAEAKSIGWGGKTLISKLAGVSRSVIACGEKEVLNPDLQCGKDKIRHRGGGRKKSTDKQAGLEAAIKAIVEPHTVGDPDKVLLWTSKSIRHIQDILKTRGYSVSHELVRQILQSLGYSLQTNRKTLEGGKHVDRDAQFEFINTKSKVFYCC